jgi:hypothetical protein
MSVGATSTQAYSATSLRCGRQNKMVFDCGEQAAIQPKSEPPFIESSSAGNWPGAKVEAAGSLPGGVD